jgi:sialate O-acetylesterase
LGSLFVAVSGVLGAAHPAAADVRLPAIFSNHMVMQAGKSVAVWGSAAAGEAVTVALAGQELKTTAGNDGRWRIKLEPLKAAGEPQTLVVRASNTLTITDVLVGEVWLCSGQSNMAMQLKGLHGQVDRADEEIAAADHPRIRMFVHDEPFDIYALRLPPPKAEEDRPGRWVVCTPETAARFSAIGYYFGRDLEKELDSPVGLVVSSVGGTPIEAWTRFDAQTAVPELTPLLADWQKRLAGYDPPAELAKFEAAKKAWLKVRAEARKQKKPDPKAPTPFKNLAVMAPGGLWNGMLAPLAPYTVRGVLWYQGERNAAGPFTNYYGPQLRTLIADWRGQWGDPSLYFAWVQLPRFSTPQKLPSEPKGWGVAVREQMLKSVSVPNTGMAVTIDLGGAKEGHPTNKADYARRLSQLALHDVYGKSELVARGPLFKGARRDGAAMVVSFDHAEGLRAAEGELTGFAIAGDDRKFVWAEATIVGGRLVVTSDKVPQPAAVRYAWAANPKCNLVNGAGLPASPFRTDAWD